MSDDKEQGGLADLIAAMREQNKLLQEQREEAEQRRQEADEKRRQDEERHRQAQEQLMKQNEALLKALEERAATSTSIAQAASIPSFAPFDSTAELWDDYYERFKTFVDANSVPPAKQPKVFLTNQAAATYKLLRTLASQQ